MTFHIRKHEAIADGLRRIANEQIGIALSHADDAAMPLQTKVHSLRKRCKKMRGLLRLAQPTMSDAVQAEDQRFKAAAKLLSVYRDSDVYAKTIASLIGPGIEVKAPHCSVSESAIEDSGKVLASCLTDVQDWPLELYDFADLCPGFSDTYRKCLEAWEDVLREPGDDKFHRLRKWAKYHWYHIRILERLNKDALRERRSVLRDLQLGLGDAHDLHLLQSMLLLEDDPDMHLLALATTRKHQLYLKALSLGYSIFGTPVNDLAILCQAGWDEWHH